ncbi:MAG: ArnT family glycosyltransferase [Chthoniobacteraceae bacterium]
MPSDQQVQDLVYQLEEGRWKKWITLGVFISIAIMAFVGFVLDPWYWGFYRGLQHPKAMEAAEIAREVSRGNGFTTKMIRPLAIAQFRTNRGVIPGGTVPDTFQAPLWPLTVAPFYLALEKWPDSIIPFRVSHKDRWSVSPRDYIYAGDRIISGVATLFLLLSIIVNYFTARRLFDNHIALWTVVFMFGCSLLWKWAQSGLPQMQMLFFFSAAMYTLVRVIEFHNDTQRWPFLWLLATTVFLGLLTLCHGIGLWVFLGTVVFCAVYISGWRKTLILMLGGYALMMLPWLWHTYKTCGNPFGVAIFTLLEQVRGTENAIMRSGDYEFSGLSPTIFRQKLQSGIVTQFSNLFSSLGGILVAPVFFLGLLHNFKHPTPRGFRWGLLSIWIFSVIGMALFSLAEEDAGSGLSANDLNVLFIPLFSSFGMAFLLVLWMRLEISVAILRYAFYVLVCVLCSFPMLNTLTMRTRAAVQWPPYFPPGIGILREWTQPSEIIVSDMPWAVAWYADRKSLWLPASIQEFLEINDYRKLGGHIAGIHLTPISGNKGLISDIVKGDFKQWAPFVLRSVNIKDFPMRAVTALPIDQQCIFYSDHDRWTDRAE